jgi:hypothetical protein
LLYQKSKQCVIHYSNIFIKRFSVATGIIATINLYHTTIDLPNHHQKLPPGQKYPPEIEPNGLGLLPHPQVVKKYFGRQNSNPTTPQDIFKRFNSLKKIKFKQNII